MKRKYNNLIKNSKGGIPKGTVFRRPYVRDGKNYAYDVESANNHSYRTSEGINEYVEELSRKCALYETVELIFNYFSHDDYVREVNRLYYKNFPLKRIKPETFDSARKSVAIMLSDLAYRTMLQNNELKSTLKTEYERPWLILPLSTKSYWRKYHEETDELWENGNDLGERLKNLGLTSYRVSQVVRAFFVMAGIGEIEAGGYNYQVAEKGTDEYERVLVEYNNAIKSGSKFDPKRFKKVEDKIFYRDDFDFSKMYLQKDYKETILFYTKRALEELSLDKQSIITQLINTDYILSYSKVKPSLTRKNIKDRINKQTGLRYFTVPDDNVIHIKNECAFTDFERQVHGIEAKTKNLTDKEKKKLNKTGFKLYRTTTHRKEELELINKYIYNSPEFPDALKLSLLYKRSFTDCEANGGRLFSDFTRMSKTTRARLLECAGLDFDEVDIHATVLNILKIKHQINHGEQPTLFTRDKDIYLQLALETIEVYMTKENNLFFKSLKDSPALIRAIIKKCIQPMFFAKDKQSAYQAIRSILLSIGATTYKKGEMNEDGDDDSDKAFADDQQRLWQSFIVDSNIEVSNNRVTSPQIQPNLFADSLVEAICKLIPEVQLDLFNDNAGFIFYAESRCIETLMLYLFSEGIPNISIFDCILLPKNEAHFVTTILSDYLIGAVRISLQERSDIVLKEAVKYTYSTSVMYKNTNQSIKLLSNNNTFISTLYSKSISHIPLILSSFSISKDTIASISPIITSEYIKKTVSYLNNSIKTVRYRKFLYINLPIATKIDNKVSIKRNSFKPQSSSLNNRYRKYQTSLTYQANSNQCKHYINKGHFMTKVVEKIRVDKP